ncbi:GntR family transcriptional regulator [Aquihabitans daechungensis]|uniref:GntR family transcriptional regulator n=1 Tax=Aquihabitans daechungensis TaxID=1052257 RepID=UPI003BA3A7DF
MQWTIDHASPDRLADQIAACVRRGVAGGELHLGEQLPPAAELADALSVNRNTVLAAYHQLRDEGLLEFRRGRGVRIAAVEPAKEPVVDAATALLALARDHGVDKPTLLRILKELP